jgi:hypothetical protein
MSQVIECLLSKCKALISTPTAAKKKKKKKKTCKMLGNTHITAV